MANLDNNTPKSDDKKAVAADGVQLSLQSLSIHEHGGTVPAHSLDLDLDLDIDLDPSSDNQPPHGLPLSVRQATDSTATSASIISMFDGSTAVATAVNPTDDKQSIHDTAFSVVVPKNWTSAADSDSIKPTDNVAIATEAQNTYQAPATESGRLMELPAELRIRVYKHLFSGSKVTLTVSDYKSVRGTENQGWHSDAVEEEEFKASLENIARSNNGYHLLLTCMTIRNDAMPFYWATTTVHCKGVSKQCFLDDFVCAIPPAILKNAKHLRNIMLPHITSTRIQGRPELQAQALLDRFPELESCEIVVAKSDRKFGRIDLRLPKDNMVDSATRCLLVARENKSEYGLFLDCMCDMRPMEWLADAYGIDLNSQVHCQ